MQRTNPNRFLGGETRVQSMLQLLLSRVQSSITGNAALVAHLPGGSMRDLRQIALRGPLLTVDDLVSLCGVFLHITRTSPIHY